MVEIVSKGAVPTLKCALPKTLEISHTLLSIHDASILLRQTQQESEKRKKKHIVIKSMKCQCAVNVMMNRTGIVLHTMWHTIM